MNENKKRKFDSAVFKNNNSNGIKIEEEVKSGNMQKFYRHQEIDFNAFRNYFSTLENFEKFRQWHVNKIFCKLMKILVK